MTKRNFHTDIEESIIRNFGFLKSYGFKDFEENQLAYEFHFESKNDCTTIDIWLEAIFSSPIWIKINQYYLDHLEPENVVLKECEQQRSKKYNTLFQLYLKKNDPIYLEKIQANYEDNGQDINEVYLKECSEIIKRNIQILNGDLEILKRNTESFLSNEEQRKTEERIKNKMYTLEYQSFPEGTIDDAYEEFSSLDLLRAFLRRTG